MRERFWAGALENPDRQSITLVGLDEQSNIVGFASGGRERTSQLECDGELYVIYLLPNAQRQGSGTLLLQRFVRELRNQGFHSLAVWVLAASPFRRFYEKLGGEIIARRSTERGETTFEEVAYGWQELNLFTP